MMDSSMGFINLALWKDFEVFWFPNFKKKNLKILKIKNHKKTSRNVGFFYGVHRFNYWEGF